MTDFSTITKITDLKRDVLEEFIASLPKEDKIALKDFLKQKAPTNSSGTFVQTRAYIFNTYFRKEPIQEKKSINFAQALEGLLDGLDE